MKEEMELANSKNGFLDNEYTIMSEILDNENVTQRELSKKLGISVSTVNVLMNKLIREGHIKMTQVSQKQVFYMLTPAGMIEKAKKTVSYLKVHYRAIYDTKDKIKTVLKELENIHDVIFVLINDDEMGEIMIIVLDELQTDCYTSNIKVVDDKKKFEVKGFNSPVLIYMTVNEEIIKDYVDIEGLKVVNLTERL